MSSSPLTFFFEFHKHSFLGLSLLLTAILSSFGQIYFNTFTSNTASNALASIFTASAYSYVGVAFGAYIYNNEFITNRGLSLKEMKLYKVSYVAVLILVAVNTIISSVSSIVFISLNFQKLTVANVIVAAGGIVVIIFPYLTLSIIFPRSDAKTPVNEVYQQESMQQSNKTLPATFGRSMGSSL